MMTKETTPEPTAETPWKIRGNIEPAPIGPLYKLGTALTALAMVLLPLVYLGLIGGVAWATYLHAVSDTALLEDSHHSRGSLWAYFVPIVVGAIVVFFMIKPLFARRAKTTPPWRSSASSSRGSSLSSIKSARWCGRRSRTGWWWISM